MIWFSAPPYLRWVAAALLLLGALYLDLRGEPTVLYPHLVRSVTAGEEVTPADVVGRPVPASALPDSGVTAGIAVADLPEGAPLVPGLLTDRPEVPDGWWVVPVALRVEAVPGTRVALVLAEGGRTVGGIVVSTASGDPFGVDHRSATVAVAPSDGPAVAAASRLDALVVAMVP